MRNQYGDRNMRRDERRSIGRGRNRDRGPSGSEYDRNGRGTDVDYDRSVGSERGPRSNYDRDQQRHFGRDYEDSGYGAQDFSRGSSVSMPNTGYETGSRGWNEMDEFDRRDWRADQEARNWRLDRDMRHQQQHGLFERLGEKVGEFFGKGPKNYKRSDERIREDVSEALYRHPYIDASEIEVNVNEAVVALSGTVPERAMKRMSEDEAEKISGVKDVNNSIRVSDANMSKPFSATPDESRKDRSKRIQ